MLNLLAVQKPDRLDFLAGVEIAARGKGMALNRHCPLFANGT